MELPQKIKNIINILVINTFQINKINWSFDYDNFIAKCCYHNIDFEISYFFDPQKQEVVYRLDIFDLSRNPASFLCSENDEKFNDLHNLYTYAQAEKLNFGDLL